MVGMNLPGSQVSAVTNKLKSTKIGAKIPGLNSQSKPGEYVSYGLTGRFKVYVDGLDIGEWSSCIGLGMSFNPEQFKAGGQYDQTHTYPGWINWSDVTIARAIDLKNHNKLHALLKTIRDDWINWDGSQPVPKYHDHYVTITLYTATGRDEVASWTLNDSFIKSWSGPDLTGGKNEVATEKLVFAHNGFWAGSLSSPDVTLVNKDKPGEAPVQFHYMPERWSLTQGILVKESGATRTTNHKQVTSMKERSFTINKLRVNGTKAIKQNSDRLFEWVTPEKKPNTKKEKLVPALQLTMGKTMQNLSVELRKVALEVIRFNQQGAPICAEFTLDLVQKELDKPTLNPTSGGRWEHRTHTMSAGDSLQWIAQSTYDSPNRWREIAEENAVDDPLRIRTGSVLLLPRTAD